jgi:DnaK suppressor protein
MEFGMNTAKARLDAAFLEKQRQYLLRLRAELRTSARTRETDETVIEAAAANSAREFEDEAQKLDALELDGNLVARETKRLEQVDRALEKIDNGTYGLSEVSGQPIPRERLEAAPDAVCTVEEEQQRESKRSAAE